MSMTCREQSRRAAGQRSFAGSGNQAKSHRASRLTGGSIPSSSFTPSSKGISTSRTGYFLHPPDNEMKCGPFYIVQGKIYFSTDPELPHQDLWQQIVANSLGALAADPATREELLLACY